MGLPDYVYVASSWRNPMQPAVCAILTAAGIDHYDFRNPAGGTGFSWSEVKTPGGPDSEARCSHCALTIVRRAGQGRWLHAGHYERETCADDSRNYAIPKKGSDWEQADEYLAMVAHPRAVEGYAADFAAMERADTFVMVLPCGKSAHLEIGYAIGAGKRTAILLEDPVEPELMYRGVDFMARNVMELLGWLGVED